MCVCERERERERKREREIQKYNSVNHGETETIVGEGTERLKRRSKC